MGVSDNGIGIPDGELENIFEEFYQINNPERDRSQGLGLGLSIVKRLCAYLNIALDIKSVVNNGTDVTLTMPVSTGLHPVQERSKVPNLESNLSKRAILVVDDEAMSRSGMYELLREFSSKVLVASGTKEAIKISQTIKPDIVLVDLRLRGSDNGIKTIDGIRNMYPEIPAIVITGDIDSDHLVAVKERKLPLMQKPLDVDKLVSLIGISLSRDDL